MNLVAGAMTFPVPAGFDVSLTRSEDTVHQMEAVGQGDLAVVLMRNLVINRGLCVVDALLLTLHVQEVQNFELWEQARVAERVLTQDWVREGEQDCFGMLVAVRATLPPSMLFADRALLCREYSISEPNALVETISKYKGLY